MKQKVALVLSGGGARGMAHIGVIEELEKHGYEITSISGTSMGSVVGGVYALGKLDAFKEWLYTLDKRRVLNLLDFTLSKQGLVKGDKVFDRMKQFMADTRIEELRIPFAAVAVDLLNKKEVVFRSGSLYNALRASVSIPTIMTPVKEGGRLLVDGGVMNNIPIDMVERAEGDLVIAVDVNANIPVKKPASTKEDEARLNRYRKRITAFHRHLLGIRPINSEPNLGYFDLMNQTLSLLIHRTADLLLEKHPPDMLIEVSRDSCETFDFYMAEELVEMGRFAALQKLEDFTSST